jgi:pimeloyl-ACP methyl ester carboxylesterase
MHELALDVLHRLLAWLPAPTAPFVLLGASWGALLAHCIAAAAPRLGARPRLLVLIDPPPPPSRWLPVMESQRAARAAVLSAQLHALASQARRARSIGPSLPEPPTIESATPETFALSTAHAHLTALGWRAEERFSFDCAHEAAMQCRAASLAGSGQPLPAVESAVLLVTATERRAFFEAGPGETSRTCVALDDDPSALLEYGEAAERLALEGDHLDVCARCASGRDPSFAALLGRHLPSE